MSNLPPQGPPDAPQQSTAPEKQKNTLGLIALIVGIVGFIFACIPGALIVGWILLPIAFILGIVGVALSGKKKGTSIAAIIVSVVGFIVGVIVFFALVASSVDEALGGEDFTPDETAESEDNADEAEDTDDTGADEDDGEVEGSRDNPFPIGESVSNGDWTITLNDPYEANDEVAAENQFNEDPENGMEFWMVPVEATYTGEDTGHAGFDLEVKFVSDEGQTYNTYEPGCGVIPGPLDEVDEVYEGATSEGNVCVQVPEGADGTWSVSTFLGDPVFFAVE